MHVIQESFLEEVYLLGALNNSVHLFSTYLSKLSCVPELGLQR